MAAAAGVARLHMRQWAQGRGFARVIFIILEQVALDPAWCIDVPC